MCFENGLPRQSADWLAMTGFFDSLASPFGRGGRAQRGRRGQTKKNRLRAVLQLVDKPSLWGQRFFYAGGARGGKARLELNQMSRKALPCKACVERSDYFRAAGRHKITTLFQAVEKAKGFFDSLRETAFGRFSLCAKSALRGVLTDGKHAPLSILTENVSPAEKQQARLRRSPRRSAKLCVRRGQKSNG